MAGPSTPGAQEEMGEPGQRSYHFAPSTPPAAKCYLDAPGWDTVQQASQGSKLLAVQKPVCPASSPLLRLTS